jgi:hypothetical protein
MIVDDSSVPSVASRISRRSVSGSRTKAATTGSPLRPVRSARHTWLFAITFALAVPREPAHRGLRQERSEDRLIAVFPRARIEQLALRADQVEPADQRRAGEHVIDRALGRRVRPEGGLHPIEERVLRSAQGHLDLLGSHRRHVARLLSVEQLGRRLPLADRDVAEDRDDRGGRHDRQERERRESRGRRQHSGGYSRSASSRRIMASVCS